MRKARARFIGAAEWHQIAQALAAAFAEIEHPRAAGNELRGKLRTSIRNGDSADTAGLVRYRFEREICVDVKGHVDLPVLMAGPSTNRRLSARRTSARRFKRTATVVNEGLIPPLSSRKPDAPLPAPRRAGRRQLSRRGRCRWSPRPARTSSPRQSPARILRSEFYAGIG